MRLVLLIIMMVGGTAWAQISESFNTNMPSGYQTNATVTLSSGTWTSIGDAFYPGTTKIGTTGYSCQIKSGSANGVKTPALNTCGIVKFWFTGTPAVSKIIGATTTALTATSTGNTSGSFTEYSVTVNDASSSIVIQIKNGTGASWLEDFSSTAYSGTPTITTTSASFGPFCTNATGTMSVAYTITGTFTGGSYAVQMSDATGTFPSNTTSNLLTTTGSSSPLTATWPSGIATGTGYRIRVVYGTTASSNNNSNNITVNAPVAQGVTTNAASSVNPTSATLNGNVTAIGSCPVATQKGFVYMPTASLGANTLTVGFSGSLTVTPTTAGTGIYSIVAGTLTASTQYTYRAYVTDGTNYTYGDPLTFTTLAPPATATLSGTLNEATLNNATFDIDLANSTYAATLSLTGFTLNSVPTGVTKAGVERLSDTKARITLAYDDTDFDANASFTVTIAASQLTTGAAVTSSNGTIIFVNETISAGTITFSPASPCINTTSGGSFALTLTSLKSGNVTVSGATAVFTISESASGPFSTDNIVFNPNGGTSKTIYVRFTPGASTNTQSATLTISGSGATTTKSLSATAVNSLPAVSSPSSSSITYSTAVLGGTLTTVGCSTSAIVERGIYYSTSTGFADGTGTAVSATGTFSPEAFTVPVSGLSSSTTYYFKAYVKNQAGTSYYSAQGSFTTSAYVVSIPYTQSFEGATPEWSLGTGTTNLWTIGNGTSNGGVKGLYISSNGSTYGYNENNSTGSSSTLVGTYASFKVDLTNVSVATALLFDWKCVGEVSSAGNVYDYGEVYINTGGSDILISQDGEFANSPNWATRTINLTPYNGNIVTIKFKWRNDVGATDGVPFAIDNVKISKQIDAPVATAATLLSTANTGFTANWNAITDAQSYKLDVSASSTFTTSAPATTTEGFEASDFNTQYTTGNVVLGSGTWAFVNAASAAASSGYINSGTDACQIQNASGNKITSPTFESITTISFWARASTNSGQLILQKIVDGTTSTVATISLTTTYQQFSYTIGSTAKLVFSRGAATIYIDDIVINYTGTSPSFITGYQNLTVSGISAPVTGLTAGNTYYYKVRAVGAASGIGANTTSVDSNPITAVAKAAKVWATTSGTTAWSPSAPVSTDAVFIEVPYTEDAGFEAGTLTVNNKLTIKTGKTVTVYNALVSNDSIIVQNNAALVLKEGATQTGTATNKAKVIRNSNALYRFDYTLWGSPVTGQQLHDFSPNTATARFYTYAYNWNAATSNNKELYFTESNTNNFTPGKAYLIRTPDFITGTSAAAYTAGTATYTHNGTFNGTLNNGIVPVPTVVTSLNGDGDLSQSGHYIAVANPYPSPISVKEFFAQNSTVIEPGNGIYFWRKKNDALANTYAHLTMLLYTSNGPVGGNPDPNANQYNNGNSSTFNDSWILSPAQGFLVKLKTGLDNTATVNFTNSMRKPAASTQPFFKTANTNDAPAVSRLWINLANANNSAFSQSGIGYLAEGTLGLDYGYDARMLGDGNARLYSREAGANLAIQARPSFTATDIVPMGFVVTAPGQYSISLDHVDGVFSTGQEVYLKDNLAGTVTSLSQNPYTFSTEAGTFDTRFEVIYMPQGELGTETPALANMVVVYQQNGAININTGSAEMTGVTIYDIRGRKLYSKNNINATETSVTGLNIAKEVIIVEISTLQGKVSKKIVF